MNLFKTKLMVGGVRHKTKKTVGKWPCVVCDKTQYCALIIHWLVQCISKRCSGVMGSLSKGSFLYAMCVCAQLIVNILKYFLNFGWQKYVYFSASSG